VKLVHWLRATDRWRLFVLCAVWTAIWRAPTTWVAASVLAGRASLRFSQQRRWARCVIGHWCGSAVPTCDRSGQCWQLWRRQRTCQGIWQAPGFLGVSGGSAAWCPCCLPHCCLHGARSSSVQQVV